MNDKIHPLSLLTYQDQLVLYHRQMGSEALVRQVEEGRRRASQIRKQKRIWKKAAVTVE